MRAILGLVLFATLLIAFTALTGNADAIDPSAIQDAAAVPIELRVPTVVGQTFRARFPRLDAIQTRWRVPNDYIAPRAAHVTLHLRASPTDTYDLAAASIPLDQIQNDAFTRFTFAPIPDSENQTYYFFFEGQADLLPYALWSSGEDAYADGALYLNGAATNRDLVFRAYYEPDLGMLARALAQTLAQFPLPILLFVVLAFSFAVFARPFAPFALLVLLALAVALLQIRDLPAPLWVDSLAHAQYVQFILTNARLPLNNFYHLGFHVLTAIAAKSLNLSIPQSLLLIGQFSWALVGVSVFFFSRKISQLAEAAPTPPSSFGALAAAACVWFLSPTPVYFITWGRYPLVLGSALLPIALLCAIQLIEQPRANARNIFFAAITFAALAFSQIRLAAFYFAFLPAYWLALRRRMIEPKQSRFLISLSLILLFLFLWLFALFTSGATLQSILAQNQAAPAIDLQTALDVLITHHGAEFYFLAALSIILGLARRSRVTFLVLGWWGALVAVALLPPLVGELVPLSLVALMAFLPAAILIGDAAQWAYKRSGAANSVVHAAVWVALIGCVSILGARDMVNIANPATILFTRADARAMEWIGANVPRDEKFLVNSFNWVGATVVPADGGGWIPFFTGNPTEYLDATTANSDSESATRQWIESRQISYIYLSTRAGVLHAADFFAQPENFSLVYDSEGVKIFRVR